MEKLSPSIFGHGNVLWGFVWLSLRDTTMCWECPPCSCQPGPVLAADPWPHADPTLTSRSHPQDGCRDVSLDTERAQLALHVAHFALYNIKSFWHASRYVIIGTSIVQFCPKITSLLRGLNYNNIMKWETQKQKKCRLDWVEKPKLYSLEHGPISALRTQTWAEKTNFISATKLIGPYPCRVHVLQYSTQIIATVFSYEMIIL